MKQEPSEFAAGGARPSSARHRLLLFAAIGCAVALAFVVIPDLTKPEHAEALSLNPLDDLSDIAKGALGAASDTVGAPLKGGFVWMVNTLFGGPQASMTMALVNYLTTMPNMATGNVMTLERNMQAVAGALLACVLTLSIMRYWLGSFTEGPGQMMAGLEGLYKVAVAALMIGLWPTLFNLFSKFFNVLSHSLLTGPLKGQLTHLFTEVSGTALLATGLTGPVGASLGMLMWILMAVATTVLFLGLLLMKIMVTAGTVIVFVAMPLALILWPIPETSWIARALAKTLAVLLAIPVIWVIIFSAAAALGSDVFGPVQHGGSDDFASTGLDAIVIKPLVAIALMYMAITIPSKLLKMAPMLGGMRGGGRASGMAIGLGTSLAARGAYGALSGGGAGAAASAGAKDKPAASSSSRLNTGSPPTPGQVMDVKKALLAGSALPGAQPLPAARPAVVASGESDAPTERRAPVASASMATGSAAAPAAWTASAASKWGQGQYQLPGNADSSTSVAKADKAGQLKQQWVAENSVGRGPSREQAQQAYNSLSPTAQHSVQQVAAAESSGQGGKYREHMASASVADNPYHGEESKKAFATLGASSPEVFQSVATTPPAPGGGTANAFSSPPPERSKVFEGGNGNGNSAPAAPRPSSPTSGPKLQKSAPSTKQGG